MTSLLPARTPVPAPAAERGARRVVVIGGGIAGLASAALLASRGHSVDLLEQHDDGGLELSAAHELCRSRRVAADDPDGDPGMAAEERGDRLVQAPGTRCVERA